MDAKAVTASYRLISEPGGARYQFFCGRSGALVCTTGPIRGHSQEETLRLAWEEGRPHFNRCQRCGCWVCDAMYNADVLECVDCAPWEEQPRYCCQCGVRVAAPATYCPSCGARLRYREVWK